MKIVICGAGPVGALAALYAAKKGHTVELYEMRADVRADDKEAAQQLGKSINITMSDRGFEALKDSGDEQLVQEILNHTVPVQAREVHERTALGTEKATKVPYSIDGRVLRVVSREFLRNILLDRIFNLPNVKVFFGRKLIHADLDNKKAVFADASIEDTYGGSNFERVSFDLLIGADGAHSAVRHHLARYRNINIDQRWLDNCWCEFQIAQADDGRPKINLDTLHVWPNNDIMFLALPNPDGTFTCNLFAPAETFKMLRSNQTAIADFFERNFPGILPNLMTTEELIKQFHSTKTSILHEMRVTPINYKDSCVLIGDAAHTMVPFYGQGLNTGLEDVRVLFRAFLSQAPTKELSGKQISILDSYSEYRQPDVSVMTSLALKNYNEMRLSQRSTLKYMRRKLEETLQARLPSAGWATLYFRVAFSTERFTMIEHKNNQQTKILKWLLGVSTASLCGLAASVALKF
ncbi:hypothetical protein JX265_010129 [Neoarthrinium moseri]|uniref:FAD-binding domain-containing protein n=1 Tax=Neoarthrinium moseri TaxID=1658444 RepID=A0A9Q0AKS0_9PEZI|nr:hypothetical protein JX266_012570 [Neoarthrinium moseri]KAI1860205.1 hypothetical protein JX265_010129 [Neoarthrinium moseri]